MCNEQNIGHGKHGGPHAGNCCDPKAMGVNIPEMIKMFLHQAGNCCDPKAMGGNIPNMMKMFKHHAGNFMRHQGNFIPYNLEKRDDGYLITVPLSGRTKGDVKVSLYNKTINIKAEKPKVEEEKKEEAEGDKNLHGASFFRNFFNFIKVDLNIPLPPDADEDDIKSVMANGLLKIKVGKKPARTINVDDENN